MKNVTKVASKARGKAPAQKAKKTRAALHQQHFIPVAEPPRPDGFIQQVNGYGTPLFAQVGSFSGI